jgi:hypothetical protein
MTLGVNRKKLEREPKFMEMLEAKAVGGLDTVLAAMRLSAEPIIQRFIAQYERIDPAWQRIVPWEAIAMLAGIKGRELLGAIIIALRSYSATEVKIAALTAHGQVTQATIQSAMQLGAAGVRDRQMIHQALGFLAVPKGQTINLNIPGSLDMPGAGDQLIQAEDIDMDDVFPDLTTTQKKLKLLHD